MASSKSKANGKASGKKMFVLDTNVLMHDPNSLFRFQEHDVFIPMATLEELDAHKKGHAEVSRNSRAAMRFIDQAISDGLKAGGKIDEGFGMAHFNGGHAKGRLFVQTKPGVDCALLVVGKNDNEILRAALGQKQERADREVILVSRDINLRIKAATADLAAEDYQNDEVVEDSDLIRTGMRSEPDFWSKVETLESWKSEGRDFWKVRGEGVNGVELNEFIHGEGNEGQFCAQVFRKDGDVVTLRSALDFTRGKNAAWGVKARSVEQSCALNLLLDPEIDLVTILGQAGSGKTMLTLAAALDLIFERKAHTEMIFTRITVPMGEDIGFLPGTEEEKMEPWMGALTDNLEALSGGKSVGGRDPEKGGSDEWSRSATDQLLKSKIKVKSMNFMRGRTFQDKILVIDEAQNLTPKQMKALVTRAGPGTKVICLGNLAQIDTPYLTEGSSGLAHVIERMKGFGGHGHITLAKVERSALAEFAGTAL